MVTSEQSVQAHEDAVLRERIADEVADVLLYLVQIADHIGVNIEGAAARKMRINAVKHLPLDHGKGWNASLGKCCIPAHNNREQELINGMSCKMLHPALPVSCDPKRTRQFGWKLDYVCPQQ